MFFNLFTWILLAIPIVFNVLIIISGKNQPENIRTPKILFYLGLINVIFHLIAFSLPIMFLTGLYTPLEEQIFNTYNIFRDTFTFLPLFFTYGIGFYLFGIRNKDIYNHYLKNAGIVFMILYIIMGIIAISNFYEVLFTISGLDIGVINLIYIIISAISSMIGIIAIIFILLHSIKFKDNFLLAGSIIMLIASGISLVLNLSSF